MDKNLLMKVAKAMNSEKAKKVLRYHAMVGLAVVLTSPSCEPIVDREIDNYKHEVMRKKIIKEREYGYLAQASMDSIMDSYNEYKMTEEF